MMKRLLNQAGRVIGQALFIWPGTVVRSEVTGAWPCVHALSVRAWALSGYSPYRRWSSYYP